MAFNIEKVKEAIYDLAEWEQVSLWNECCEDYNYMDDYIYNNDPDELMAGQKPSDILSTVDMDSYSLNDDWACYTIYGWASFSWLSDKNSPFDIDELVEWYCEYDGYEQTDLLDYEELIEDEDEDEEEDEEEQKERLEGCRKRQPSYIIPRKNLSLLRGVAGDFNTLTYESIKFKLLYGADALGL